MPIFPPGNVWDTYILFLFIPFLFRIFLLGKPFFQVSKQLVPHGKWFLNRLKDLPIKGLGIIAFNEIMAFSLPIFLVLILRLFSDKLGWSSWDTSPTAGIIILFVLMLVWLFFDFIRIARIRRMLFAIQKQNIANLRKIADAGLGVRGWLRKFSKKDEKSSSRVNNAGKSAGKKIGITMWKARKITPSGILSAVATGAAIEAARLGAGKMSDMIDEKLQSEFDKIAASNTRTLLILFVRDFVMGLAPLVALWLIPMLLP